jgi:proteasome assembly chaperone (PAC2) family protein
MLAAWPGISNVAMIVGHLPGPQAETQELARIRPNSFFDPVGVMVRGNLVEEPQFPQSIFYYYKNPNGNDLVLFLGESQPSAKSYDLANCIADVAERFHVQRIYTCAAAITASTTPSSPAPGAWAPPPT